MSDSSEKLRIMAANIDATRPEHDYSLAHKRVDDADIDALIRAADEIERLTAERERLIKERDELRCEVCDWVGNHFKEPPQDVAKRNGWDCFDTGVWDCYKEDDK